MAKPIFIVTAPSSYDQLMMDELGERMKDKMEDYHVLVTQSQTNEHFEFKCFYEKDFVETNLEELKEYLKNISKPTT